MHKFETFNIYKLNFDILYNDIDVTCSNTLT